MAFLCNISEAVIYEETLPYSHFTPGMTKPSAFKAFDTVALILCCYHSPTQPTGELLCMIHLPRPSFSTTWKFCQSSRDVSFHWLMHLLTPHTWRPQASVSPQLIKLTCCSCGTTSLPFITNAWGRKPLAFGSLLLLQFLLSVSCSDINHSCFVGLETESWVGYRGAELVTEVLMLLGEVFCVQSHIAAGCV